MKKKIGILAVSAAVCLAVAVLAFVAWVFWANGALEQTTYTVAAANLPAAFDGYRIAQISDLHNAQMGDSNEKLLKMLKEAKPDMIAITGDLVDSRNTDISVALAFAQKAMQIAPCYYVPGNHEARLSQYEDLKEDLAALGVVVLENQSVEIERNGKTFLLLGVKDPSFQTDYLTGDAQTVMENCLKSLPADRDTFTVLLSHRPELFDVYVAREVSLVLTGHAHGGQFRLPIVGGLVAPNQGLFPQYDAGLFQEGETVMIVSRGIGSSIIPLRFCNRPEVVVVQLASKG